ncbi:pilus assembly protein [Legionella norrlandica]|uniref:Pilus assembly protein n=1 Tax=Legionella norrlandica TaxID=1498499 RepID=A0A0A2STM1_9GAMM|nr:prepilin-type N-terminal cleavage/methylation domain-containing protein [Legionella norrlandica]KGP64445.1 pilus assembly protein [Legionella norrlandica]
MKSKGFTLIEIVVTLAILSGLLFIGTKSLFSITQKNERQVLIDNIKTAIQYSKIQAISLGAPLHLTPLNSNENWSNGMALLKLNEASKKMELIYQWQWNSKHWNIDWHGVDSTNKITLSNNLAHAISNGKFILDNRLTHEKVTITLNRFGRVKTN